MEMVKETIKPTMAAYNLPPIKNKWNKIKSHPLLMPYYRLAALVILINIIAVYLLPKPLSGNLIMNLTLVNFGIGIFIRQQWVINTLFKIATSIPTSAPLSLRWAAGKVYHFGGIHVGGFISGYVFYILFLSTHFNELSNFIKVLTAIHVVLLSTIMYVSLPFFRHKHHNIFEIVARFGNWTSLFLFWVLHTYLFLSDNIGFSIIEYIYSFGTLALLYLTFCTALPWLRLKKVDVDIETPSSHASLARFNYGVTPFAGSSTELSHNPLFEWHSFANIPTPGEDGFRLTISRAGDWTGALNDNKPKKIWVKGIPAAGVGNIELLFKRVIWVATGSGIGPCIPHLLSQKVPSRLVWSTRSPEKTYGKKLCNEILQSQPDALIWDTTKDGKPDLIQLAYQAYKEFDAEAVICISNKKTTFNLNHQLESRGIPSFGAIWDS